MRVLWTHNFNPAELNAGVFMFTAAEGLRDLGVDVQLEYLGNLRSPLNILKAQKHVKKISKEFDLVHAQYGSACAIATSTVKDCPKVLSLRGSDWNVHTASLGFLYWHTRLAKLMTQLAVERYDLVIAVSNRMVLDLQQNFPKVRSIALPSPIDVNRFVLVDKEQARLLLGFPNNKEKWVLFTSGDCNNPIKRYSLARQAVDLANAKLGNVRMRVASGLPHSELPLFVAACDLILCTSDNEGWPNSIKEALACNLPFVSTDVSDLRNIADKESTCRICPPDAAVLAENICDVLSTPRTENLRRHVIETDVSTISERLLDLYMDLVSRK
jgi:glycosyltransferase involved in cell wall biosynthesis